MQLIASLAWMEMILLRPCQLLSPASCTRGGMGETSQAFAVSQGSTIGKLQVCSTFNPFCVLLRGMAVWRLPGVRGRGPAHLSPRSQLMANNGATRCGAFVAKGSLAGEASYNFHVWRRQFYSDPTLWWESRQQDSCGSLDPRLREPQDILFFDELSKSARGVAALDVHMGGCAPPSNSIVPHDFHPRRPVGYEMEITAETVSKSCHQGQLAEAIEALGVLVHTHVDISTSLFYTVLKECVAKKDLVLARLIHALMVKKGYETNTFLCNHILRVYASHGRLKEAMGVFTVVEKPDVFTWCAIISAHVKHGQDIQAIELYQQMRRSSVKPNGHVFAAALQACAMGGNMKLGQQVHIDVLASGIQPDLFVCSSLVDMYAKCGSLDDARRVFDGLPQKDVVTWNAMIGGYSQQGMGREALRVYSAMQASGGTAPNSVTYVCLLQACASVRIPALESGRQLHAQIGERGLQADVVLGGSLVNMYAKCGSLEDARGVFDGLGRKNVVTWNAMISGYCQHGMGQQALGLRRVMQEDCAVPDPVTLVCLLQACASVGSSALEEGRQIHSQIRERGLQADVVIASSLVDMYAKCGSIEEARGLFDRLVQKNVVTWSAMIAGYAHQDMGQESLLLYDAMQKEGMTLPNLVTFVCLLQVCASLGISALEKGRQLHAQIIKQGLEGDILLANGLVSMYIKCGSLEDAQGVFTSISVKNIVTWNAMISAYSQQGMGQEALLLYSAMQKEGIVLPNTVTFVSLLQACAAMGTRSLEQGKQFHAEIVKRGLVADVVVGGSLVNMYAKCGSLEDARAVFEGLGKKNVVTWSALIAGYSQQDMGHEALDLYSAMQEEAVTVPDSVTFVSLLQACASVGLAGLEKGKELHAQIREQGLHDDVSVANSLVNMYAKCGNLEDAQGVFDGLCQRNVVTWSALIAGYSQQGMGEEALRLYKAMQEEGIVTPNSVTFVCLLQAYVSLGTTSLDTGKQLHEQIRDQGLETDVVVGGSLVNMYAKCGRLEDALCVFKRLSRKTVVTWNAMIGGYCQRGMAQEALDLYAVMQMENAIVPDSVTFLCLLQSCASLGTPALEKGKQLHAALREQGLQADMFVASSLVDMYAKCGSLKDARALFDGLGEKNVGTWNAMIAGYSQQGMGMEALCLHKAMQEEGISKPNSVSFVCLLQSCASLGPPALEQGKQLHAAVTEQGLQANVVIANSLVNMYAKCGSLEDAKKMFAGLPQKDVVTWNSMIAGISQQGMGLEALNLVNDMPHESMAEPSAVTLVCLLQACASVGPLALEQGRQLDARIRERGLQEDVFLASSLVNMYAKCGSLEHARAVFDGLSEKNVVTWSAMISGYSQQGMGQEALRLYSAMQQEGIVVPNSVTFVCLLQACASVAALDSGRQIHAQIKKRGLETDLLVAGSLMSMYGKCGSAVDAQQLFEALEERNVAIWNALIAAYSRQGHSEKVFDLVVRMSEDGIKPDGVTFLSLLAVCSHGGLVKRGRDYFDTMSKDYGIAPTVDHYTCMVDLLGRAGQLDDALAVARTMPVLPTAAVWHTLLGACQKWRNVEIAFDAFSEAVKLDKKDAASYVLMSNIYTSAQMWEQAQEMHARRVQMKAWKQPGLTWWTDMDGLVHNFSVRK